MNNTIPAVDRAIQILTALAVREYTQAELAEKLQIPASSVYRILMTLSSHRWVRKKSGGVYSLAEGLLPLTGGIEQEMALLDGIALKLTALSAEYNIAGKISVRRENEQVTRFRIEPPSPAALTGAAGSSFPLIEGSVGAALLVRESPANIAALIKNCPVDIPEKRAPELLEEAIREARRRGTVLNIRPNRWNIAALSIPVFGSSGAVLAAVTVIGTTEDFSGSKRDKWEKILKETIKKSAL